MRAFAGIALVLACSGSATSTTPNPANRAPPSPGEITNLRVSILIAYDEYCKEPHRVTVSLDGVQRGSVTHPCKVLAQPGPNGVRVIVTESGLPTYELPPIVVPPGQHRVTVHDSVTNISATRELTFPTYSKRSPHLQPEVKTPLAEVLPVYVRDESIAITDLVYGFFTM